MRPVAEQNKNSRTRTMTQPTGFPDFFVVGAPRCGTTSLCRFFAKNPQICFSRPKEPHYFAQLRSTPSPDELQRDYIERYFGHRHGAHRAVGEGSVSYLYAPEAIERIRHFNPEARFIVMVRNPMSMLPSYHLKMRFLLQEDKEDFATAWRLQEARARGENLPAHCLDPRTLMYGEVARYGAHIERLFEIAGRERTHVIVFDDFVADQLATYRRALEFLASTMTGGRYSSAGTRAGSTATAGCRNCFSCRWRAAPGSIRDGEPRATTSRPGPRNRAGSSGWRTGTRSPRRPSR